MMKMAELRPALGKHSDKLAFGGVLDSGGKACQGGAKITNCNMELQKL